MSRLRLLKTVALCFVEAARVTLEHLGVRRLEFTEDSSRMVAELSRVYSDVRRLRDNLQRAVNGFGDTVEVEMTPEDTAVLVACCRRAFEYIEAKLATDEVRAEERRTLKEKQNVIGRWAYELAAKPLLELPLRRLTIEGTEASRSLQVKLLAKVQGIGTLEPQPASAPGTPRMPVVSFGGDPIAAPPTDPEAQGMQTYGNNQVARGPMDPNLGGMPQGGGYPQGGGHPQSGGHPQAGYPPAMPPGNAYAQGNPYAQGNAHPHGGGYPQGAGHPAAMPPRGNFGPGPGPRANDPNGYATDGLGPAARPAPQPPLYDHNRLHDPRLRMLAAFDLQSYAAAVAAQDLRVATALLAAILECALIDHVMPRRHEFEVSGDPVGWDMAALVLAALGDRAQAADRALSRHVFSARNMLRPSIQYLSPTIVTPSSFDTLRKFTQRCIYWLGYGGPSE